MSGNSLIVGVDLGGTKLDIGLVDDFGHIIDRILVKTKAQEGAQVVIHDMIEIIEELRLKAGNDNILAVGVGIAGQIHQSSGVVRFAPNLHWHDVPLQSELNKALQLPIYVTNDVRAAAWGEWLYGAGKGSDDLLCLFVGTGIGSGVVSGGRMLTGCSNSAGEVGHLTIDMNGPRCACGNFGCFEALAAGWAIARRAREVVDLDPKRGKALLDLVNGNITELSAKHVFLLCRSGDSVAQSIVDEVTKALIVGVAGLINAFNPQRLILGGGIIHGYPEFIEAIRQGVAQHALKVGVEPLSIVQAGLHGDAGVVGAAAFARDACQA